VAVPSLAATPVEAAAKIDRGHEVAEDASPSASATATAEYEGQAKNTADSVNGTKATKSKKTAARCRTASGANEDLAAAAADFLAANPKATGAEVARAIGRAGRTGRRYKAAGLELLAARNGHAATATLPVDMAEDITEAVTGHADAENMAEYGHDLMDHIADMAAVG
jgi:hypothetical protein